MFAALEAGTGQVRGAFSESNKRADFIGFLEAILGDQPPDKEIHVILDNYCTHKRNDAWLAKFGSSGSPSAKPIEVVFSPLQRKTLRGASFKSKDQLREAIGAFIRNPNARAKPFRWRKREVKGSRLRNTLINLRN